MGEFQHQVVGAQGIEEVEQGLPGTALDGLAAVVAEAEVDGLLHLHLIEDAVDGQGSEGTVGRVAGNVGLVHLHAGAVEVGDLRGHGIRDGEGERLQVLVVIVQQGAG